MTTDEKNALNRSVARCLGWEQSGESGWLVYDHNPVGTYVGFTLLPDFVSNPEAADLVIREIARKQWTLNMSLARLDPSEFAWWDIYIQTGNGKFYSAGGGEITDPAVRCAWGKGLCEAFVRACEAQS